MCFQSRGATRPYILSLHKHTHIYTYILYIDMRHDTQLPVRTYADAGTLVSRDIKFVGVKVGVYIVVREACVRGREELHLRMFYKWIYMYFFVSGYICIS